MDMDGFGDRTSIASVRSVQPTADTLAKLVGRLRALTLTLLPVEISPAQINDPASRIITPQVIAAYTASAGDLVEALPYCLLRARSNFMLMANQNAADYDENLGRAVACEVLARRIIHKAPSDRLVTIISTRYRHLQSDGDVELSSALELAIDSHCTIFLSSSEAQDVVNYLWKGDLVQQNHADHDIDYMPFEKHTKPAFWKHFDPARIAVPRYQNAFRIIVWLLFLVVYSQAVREPLDRLNSSLHKHLDEWEIVLYIMSLSFSLEEIHKIYKLMRFATWRAFSFWNVVAFITDCLFVTAFALRIAGVATEGSRSDGLRLWSFQVLSFAAPFIWLALIFFKELITIFDGYKYMGTMQICVARMLKESGIFFALLSVLGVGFLQGLYALDAADGSTESSGEVVHSMVQALLGSPNFDKFDISLAGLTLFYFWNVVTSIVLLNVLISLFSSAYSDVVEDAEAEFLAYFAGKTVGMIRAPDEFVYPAPFNLIETFLVAPLDYKQLNRFILTVLLFIPLTGIALFETTGRRENEWLTAFFSGGFEDDDSPAARDPTVEGQDADQGLKISRVPFSELITVFPNTHESSETNIVKEIHGLKAQLDVLLKKLEDKQ
ncbi:calcium activated cation channel [Amylostereum chailletii]|nr:calcium activated cation channel [Amylostereum chailletii]